MKTLIFGFNAPMASFGTASKAKLRDTESRPTKSAILGMCAAALGYDREAADKLGPLYKLNVATWSTYRGKIDDYQTISAFDRARGPMTSFRRAQMTRYDMTTDNKVRKIFLTDVQVRAALWANEAESEALLEEIGAALPQPVFSLYAGRRSCPISLLVPPTIVSTDNPDAAMRDAYFREEIAPTDPPHIARLDRSWTFYSDLYDGASGTRRTEFDQPVVDTPETMTLTRHVGREVLTHDHR